ncbi:MAG: hypothetical protein ACYDCL_15855 [Myxococcales bacterium]
MHTVLLTLTNVLVLSQAPASDPCAATAGHGGYTILLEDNGHFVHCRDGATTEDEPVSHERVVLQLPAEGPEEPWRYRLFDPTHPEAGHRNPLLLQQLEVIEGFQETLHDLANSPESLGETLKHLEPAGEEPAAAPPAAAPTAGKRGQPPAIELPGGRESREVLAAQAAQAKYLTYATPAFVDAVHALRRNFRRLDRAAAKVDDLCATSALKVREGKLREKILGLCAGGPGARALTTLAPFKAALESYIEARAQARDAVLDLDLTPTSAAEQDAAARKAAQVLAAATGQARKLVADAQDLTAKVEDLFREVQLLRAAISIPTSPESPRLTLGHFSANGLFSAPDIYQVHVLKRPSRFLEEQELTEGGAAEEKAEDRELLVDRFQPASRNYVDIGLAAMYSAGLPDHAAITGRPGGQQTLSSEKTSGFNGGVLLALEPLQFTTLPDPWSELLHFPTVIIPFTLDPIHNYFIGAGVGILDVASIDVGAHLAFDTVPQPGYFYGETFANTVTHPDHVVGYGSVAGGYFVSLSIDLVGVIHLIVDQLSPTVRDVHSNSTITKPAN